MKAVRNYIQNTLQNYKVPLNRIDSSLPLKGNNLPRVAVIGGGLAGMTAALELAEKGFRVTLYEKNSYWGGKLGSWTFADGDKELRTTHGFHAFFNQYYNLNSLLEKLHVSDALIDIDDYKILFNEQESVGFKGLDTTPVFNVLALRKRGIFHWTTFLNPLCIPLLDLFRYDEKKTFRKYDHMSFADFARKTMMPAKMKVVFSSFARAFFAEPDKMSMAELIKGFHFYFLSNDKGLLYKTLNDDFEYSLLQPFLKELEKNGVDLRLQCEVKRLAKTEEFFEVNDEQYEHVILSLDPKGAKALAEISNGLHVNDFSILNGLKSGTYYAVYRVWTNQFEKKKMPFFVITDKKKVLDSITFYHDVEKESQRWSRENNGGIFELHSYSLPEDMTDEEEIKQAFLEEFFHYVPELKGMEIKHTYFQYKNDFPAFHIGQRAKRPEVEMETEGLYCAGDWIKMDNPSMLMEAACTSAIQASNAICRKYQIRETPLYSVPLKGVLA